MKLLHWVPAMVLGIGCFLSEGVRPQLAMQLRTPLEKAVPITLAKYLGTDLKLPDDERAVAGVTNYLLRSYKTESSTDQYSVYVGYYDRQTRGRSIHSPKNCMPGGGWEALSSRTAQLVTAMGMVTVNRYLLHRNGEQVLVLYWYQGRGRVAANEFQVKADLLRDAALRRRSEEALVRIVVPIKDSEEVAFQLAVAVAIELVPAVGIALPN